jgi:hypothetical protein
MSGINVQCNHCKDSYWVARELAGDLLECPECGWKVAIPFDADGDRDPPSDSDGCSRLSEPVVTGKQLLYISGASIVVFMLVIFVWSGTDSRSSKISAAASQKSDTPQTGYMGQTPDAAARDVLGKLNSTQEGRVAVERLASKDDQLTDFQNLNGISDRIAEAAIKEWVTTHGGNFNWDLEAVKSICLRNMRSGIPYKYLPESEKRR